MLMQQRKSLTSPYSLRLAVLGMWGALFFCSGLFVAQPHIAQQSARRFGAESLLLSNLSSSAPKLPPRPLFALAGMHMLSAVAIMMCLQGLSSRGTRREV